MEVTVLTIGRFVETKDYLTALHAFKIVTQNCLQEHIKIKYLIIGYAPF